MECLQEEGMRWLYAIDQYATAHPFWFGFFAICAWLYISALLEKD